MNPNEPASNLTKREYFIKAVMQGLLSNPSFTYRPDVEIAEAAISQTDTLFEVLEDIDKPASEKPTDVSPAAPAPLKFPVRRVDDTAAYQVFRGMDDKGMYEKTHGGLLVHWDDAGQFVIPDDRENRIYLQPDANPQKNYYRKNPDGSKEYFDPVNPPAPWVGKPGAGATSENLP